jgi:hypothetical protein
MQGKPAASEPEFLRIDLRGPVGKNGWESQRVAAPGPGSSGESNRGRDAP